jgi:hypothetical protein
VALDVNGVISASGSTSGAAHSSSAILYLLDTPQINEWQWTGPISTATLRVTYSNIPSGCKAVLADVFMSQTSREDHVGHMLGKSISPRATWAYTESPTVSGRKGFVQPSTTMGDMAQQVIYLHMPGQGDAFEYYYGKWWPSQIIPLDTDNKMYHSVIGVTYSDTSAWVYIVTKGYYL